MCLNSLIPKINIPITDTVSLAQDASVRGRIPLTNSNNILYSKETVTIVARINSIPRLERRNSTDVHVENCSGVEGHQSRMNPYQYFAYPGASDPWIQPAHLGTIATVFGLTPAELNRCNLLELGCADGVNLLHFAAAFPQSTFVGLDIADDQISKAKRAAEALNLTNITFESKNVAEFSCNPQEFDFILCPGIFSWVSDSERNSMLEIIQHGLSTTGVAGISWNVFPGWHSHQAVRNFVRRHVKRSKDAHQAVRDARRAVDFLAQAARPESVEQLAYLDVQRIFRSSTDHYIYHDYITELNQPQYFHEFVDAVVAHGLQFVSECEVYKAANPNVSTEARRTLDSLPHHDREQLIDFTVNTSYRRSILCRKEQPVNRRLDHCSVRNLYVSLPKKMAVSAGPIDDHSPMVIEFEGRAITTIEPAAKAAFAELSARWPTPMSIAGLVANCGHTENDDVILHQAMLAGFAAGVLQLFRTPPECATAGDRPLASAVNRHLAVTGRNFTDAWNRNVTLSDTDERWLLSQLDGTKTVGDLISLAEKQLAQNTAPTLFVEQTLSRFEQLLLLQASAVLQTPEESS